MNNNFEEEKIVDLNEAGEAERKALSVWKFWNNSPM